ncbi:MAG: hypothetical protein HY006_02100 [Candidatus Sungbacteria bacterium]|nr:hypothetical protein [Candidatus Sungbacteria bacterium]
MRSESTFYPPANDDLDPFGEKKPLADIALVKKHVTDTRSPQDREKSARLMTDIEGFLEHSTTMHADLTAAVLSLFDLERYTATREDQRHAFARLINYFKANEDLAVASDPRITEGNEHKPNGLAALRLVLERMNLPAEELAFYKNLLNEYTVKPEAFNDLKPNPDESFLFEGENVNIG